MKAKLALWLLFPLILLQSCFPGTCPGTRTSRGTGNGPVTGIGTNPRRGNGELLLTEANPAGGFNYSYFLFIPDGTPYGQELTLIVEPCNSGFADDDYDRHLEKGRRTASIDFYIGNYVARKLNCPLIVPVFPRPESEWEIYTHLFDRDVATQKNNSLERIDLQLLAMIEDAQNRLREKGYMIREQILMTGFSASGSFVNRFTAIHPGKILAAAAGGTSGLLICPVDSLEGSPLGFPLGTFDFQKLFGRQFDAVSFSRTPQYYYIGEHDTNDAVPYKDGYDQLESHLVSELLGKEIHPARWNKCINIYLENNIMAKFKTYERTGHEVTDDIREDVLRFFREQLNLV
ncbi:MAG: hypothetical protein MUE37_10405 [Bacteroidales bacterium]|jgi:hypothetical protein|nr:hypothetical protein [Bacteroidales bacterium]